MTWAEALVAIVKEFRPLFYVGFGLFALYIIVKITDHSIVILVSETVDEFKKLLEAKVSAKAANALGMLLLFALALYLYHGGLSHLVLPEKHSEGSHGELAKLAINAVVILLFGCFQLISILISKSRR